MFDASDAWAQTAARREAVRVTPLDGSGALEEPPPPRPSRAPTAARSATAPGSMVPDAARAQSEAILRGPSPANAGTGATIPVPLGAAAAPMFTPSPAGAQIRQGFVPGGGAAGPATAQSGAPNAVILLDPARCAQIIAHQPAPDVAYQPGRDALGRPVAPADLPSATGATGRVGTDLLLDPTRSGGAALPSGVRGESSLGQVTVDAQGRALLNGRPLDGDAEIAALCRKLGLAR